MPDDVVRLNFDVDSDGFLEFCAVLNAMEPDPGAQPSFELMSGGFVFPDELPEEAPDLDPSLSNLRTGVVRFLWGYRISLVLEAPRTELVDVWNEVLMRSPNWPGFLLERRDCRMRPVAESCMTYNDKVMRDIDRIDAVCRRRQDRARRSEQAGSKGADS